MIILIVDNSIAFTGALKSAIQEATLLSDRYRFVFVLPRNSQAVEKLREKDFKVYTLPFVEISRSFRNLLYVPMLFINCFRLQKIIRRENVEVVQMNDFYNLLGVLIRIVGFKGKLITYVRFLPDSLPGLLRKFWSYLAQRFSFRVIGVSDAVVAQLPARKNTIRIYNPVAFDDKMLPSFEPGKMEVKLLYLANYIRGKGQNFALEAFAAAIKEYPSVRLVFAGSDMGLEKNRKFRQELIDRASELGISRVVHFQSFSEDVESLIKSSDIVLNFSLAESFSLTCAEASFYGRPVIASRCGGPEEIIVHEKTGLLVGNGNIEEMKAAILYLSTAPELREQFGRRGREYVSEKFHPSVFKHEFIRLVEEK